MISQELVNFIKQNINSGKSQNEIKQNLLSVGWQEIDINNAFASLNPSTVINDTNIAPAHNNNLILIIEIILLCVIIPALFFLSNNSSFEMWGMIGSIATFPGIIIAGFGFRDAIRSIKKNEKNGVLILILSIALVISFFYVVGQFVGIISMFSLF